MYPNRSSDLGPSSHHVVGSTGYVVGSRGYVVGITGYLVGSTGYLLGITGYIVGCAGYVRWVGGIKIKLNPAEAGTGAELGKNKKCLELPDLVRKLISKTTKLP